jgi:NAD(P)-dependent dehydrogenase (short-subunit alcohol dehydrogenase family)
VNKFAKDFKYD